MKSKNGVRSITLTCVLICAALPAAGVTFQNIAAGGGAGLTYGRTPSPRIAALEAARADGVLDLLAGEYETLSVKNYGAPGVAVLDYDNDGDLDIYVTNGPGTPNSLFKNLLKETGHLSFQDVAQSAGAALTSQDSNGVCFGDIDNDGDADLYVTGYQGNHLLENHGNGTFGDITGASGTGGQTTTSVSCAMGDINADGLLDILVANTFDFANNLAYAGTLNYFQYNQLLVNQGNKVFADQTAASGLNDVIGMPQPGVTLATWAVSLIDIDLDGDLDAMVANDDHGNYTGVPSGFIRLFRNDGSGHFVDDSAAASLNRVGEWHGLAFGDLNCDGRLDIFGTNVGDYVFNPGFFAPGTHASKWFLGQSGGTFSDPGVGALVTTPHGWGGAIADYDNDGDQDIIYHGGWEFQVLWDESNPGVVLNNTGGCSANFTWDSAALASTDHLDRNVEGVATGDFNNDGFIDVASVSSFDVVPGQQRVPLPSAPQGSIFDPYATMFFVATPTDNFLIWEWHDFARTPGSLAVEINSGNGNRWAAFNLVGSKGLVNNQFATGRVNRDGIGAIVRFTPQGGQPTLTPVLGGSSYASQNSLTVEAGMGSAVRGTAEVIWPGGVKNRLYDVAASERLTLPEIPCSFDAAVSRADYMQCVTASLHDLRTHGGLLTGAEAARLEVSAIRAYNESH
jgi:hypothetical protein